MATAINSTLKQLLDIYQQSKLRGEVASLSLETKDGKEHIHFTLGGPVGNQSGHFLANERQVRRKTPSQLRRDKKRKTEFLAKKAAEAENIKNEPKDSVISKANMEIPDDEINLETFKELSMETNVFKVKGDFKDPNRKPWLQTHDKTIDEHKSFMTLFEKNVGNIGVEDFSDSSTYIEHFLEFWGELIVKPGITREHLQDLKNWPEGVGNLEVEAI